MELHERYSNSGQLVDDALNWAQDNPDLIVDAFERSDAYGPALERFAHSEAVDHQLAQAGL